MDHFGLTFDPEMPPCATRPCPSTERPLVDSVCYMHRSEAFDLDYGLDTFSVRSTDSTASAVVQRRWDIVTGRAARTEKLRSKIEHVKSCLIPRFNTQRTLSRDIGDCSGFDEYARKQSNATTTTTSSTGASTSFDFEIDAPVTALPQLPSEDSDERPRRRRSSARLARLSTRVSDIVRSGFTKLPANPEEEDARQKRRLREKRTGPRRMSEIDGFRSDANPAPYGPFVYGTGDPRTALAFMLWL